jgi:hypothetical protein
MIYGIDNRSGDADNVKLSSRRQCRLEHQQEQTKTNDREDQCNGLTSSLELLRLFSFFLSFFLSSYSHSITFMLIIIIRDEKDTERVKKSTS